MDRGTRWDSSEKTLMLGKTEGQRRRGWQRLRELDSNTYSVGVDMNKLWETGGKGSRDCCNPRGRKDSDTT